MNDKKIIKEEKPKRGPPFKEIIWKHFEDLCSLQCTQSEMASKFGLHRDTLRAKVKEHYGEDYSAVYKKFAEVGLISLRSMQFAHARKNPATAIFLGKVLLGQKEDNRKDIENEILRDIIKSGDNDRVKEYLKQS